MKVSLPNFPKKQKLKVSVIVVNYNTGKYLFECLQSIENTTNGFKSPSTEVIIIDNASTDGSILDIGKYSKIQQIKVIGNSENLGFSKAVNQGIKAADGEYIFLLNPDCRLGNGVLERLINYAEEHKNVGAIGPKLLNSDGTVQTSVVPFPTIGRAIGEFILGKHGYSKYVPEPLVVQNVDCLVMAAFLITPKSLSKVGYLDERYFLYFEDLQYCLDLNKANLKVVYYPEVEVLHHHGISGRKLSNIENQWKRLVPSSKIYHGRLKHYIINFIIWFGSRVLRRWI